MSFDLKQKSANHSSQAKSSPWPVFVWASDLRMIFLFFKVFLKKKKTTTYIQKYVTDTWIPALKYLLYFVFWFNFLFSTIFLRCQSCRYSVCIGKVRFEIMLFKSSISLQISYLLYQLMRIMLKSLFYCGFEYLSL